MLLRAPGMTDLMAQVGYLLLHWGFLENDLRNSERTLSDVNWLGMGDARRIRNLVAHGMFRACVDYREAAEPYVLCMSDKGETQRVTFAELASAIQALEKGKREIS